MDSEENMEINSPAIALEHLTKYYRSQKGIENVSLVVEQGTIHGFLGPNGAGKTTTIRILVGLLNKSAGKAWIFGKDAGTIDAKRLIGYLPSDFELYRYYTVKEYLDFIENLRGSTPRREELERRLDLDISRKTSELSRGNKQKVAIVQALMHEPLLLIADEPTTGLDPLMQEVFNELLKEYVARGNTAFISSHILTEVQEICENVSIIKNGEIVSSGNVDQLLANLPRKAILKLKEGSDITQISKKLVGQITAQSEDKIIILFDEPVGEFVKKLIMIDSIDDFLLPEPDLEEYFIPLYQKS